MDYKLAVLSILLVTCLASNQKKGSHKMKHDVINRQQIFGQRSNANPPISPFGSELQRQLKEQVNSDSRALDVTPTNADALNGLTGEGIGMPFGTLNRRIDKNPLIGANGLTKSSLSDIMFGSLKGLVKIDNTGGNEMSSFNGFQPESIQGGDMRQIMGGQMNMDGMNGGGANEIGNMLSNAQPMSLNALAALNNLAGSQGLNAFGARGGALNGMVNGGNMNGASLTALGLTGINPNFLRNPGTGANSFVGPMQDVPNPAMGLQLMSQQSNMHENQNDSGKHHKRHHRHKKHHRKSTTKLLLSLLVDKLKDIYELDQMTASNRKLDASSVGKIGLTLDDLGVPKGDVHHGHENKSESSNNEFKTKLSFPVTISDSKATEQIHLTDEASRKNFEGLSDDDDAKIQKILSGLGIKEGEDNTMKKSDKNDSTSSILKDIESASETDAKAKAITLPFVPEIKGQEFKTENAKSRDKIDNNKSSIEDEMKMEEEGSLSEFHKIKMNNVIDDSVAASSIAGVKSDVFPASEILNYKEQNQEVTAPQFFSVSSLLNHGHGLDQQDTSSDDVGEDSGNIDRNLKILGMDASKKTVSSDSSIEKILPYVPSDVKTDEADLKSLTDVMSHDVKTKIKDGENYVKAARVLGAVFKKVKDPVAKNSIETAIKAMLQVMKDTTKESSSSKKHSLPSDMDTKLVEQIQSLKSVVHQLKRNLLTKNKTSASSQTMIQGKNYNNLSLYGVIRRRRLQSKSKTKTT